MSMTREERVNLHKKQDRMQVLDGVPVAADLQEGIPTLRKTEEGLVEYVKRDNILYKNVKQVVE